MRVYVTGGSGFVGSNAVHVALEAGHDVRLTGRRWSPPPELAHWDFESVDITSDDEVTASIERYRPDVVIHSAILNDHDQMAADRDFAWRAYVDATRFHADAAAAVGAHCILVSTDWVFDGTQVGADESTPPNPVNLYGVLKMASEIVALEHGAAVARVSGVNGPHRARPDMPREQDPGFGYFVASIVDALGSDRPFTVWESDTINHRASPSLASECGRIMVAIGEGRHEGIFHCCGSESVTRRELAELTAEVFELEPSLLRYGPPPPDQIPDMRVPYDTSIVAPRTAEVLGYDAPDVRSLLEMFREEMRS